MTGDLLERGGELRAVDDLLDAARAGAGYLLLVEGHAGIGKTALLDAAVARAHAGGATVMRAQASELESDFAFGVALQLFEPLLANADDDAHDRLLAGSAALAGPLLERPTSWIGDEADDRSYTVIHGLFWLLSNLAESGPVLVVIDDAHWADRTSLRLLLYLLQRVGAMHVAIVAARRLGEPGAPDDLLGQIAAHASSRPVRPRALTRDGARELVAAVLPAADDAFADACWRMTEGNCFLLGELVRAIGDEGWEPTAHNAPRIGTLAPEAVLRAVAVRLMRLSDDAAGVARAVAILGDDAQLRHVATLTGRDAARVAAAADALAAGEILRPPDPGVLRFAHPLLASAVYADVGAGERAALHRRAAEILHDEDVSAERVAAHLLPSAGSSEAWVVRVLCAAASRALRDGAPESAASYLRRALAEPPVAAARPSVLRWLGVSEAATDLPSAVARLEEALEAGGADHERAHTLLDLGRARACNGDHAAAIAAFESAATDDGADDDVVLQAAAEGISLGMLVPHGAVALLAVEGVAVDGRDADGPQTPGQRMLLATRCLREAMAGAAREEVVALAERALGGPAPRLPDHGGGSVLAGLSMALHACDELALNDRLLTEAMTHARGRGSMMTLATACLLRGASRWGEGRLDEAIIDIEQAVDAERYGWRQFLPAAYGMLVTVHVDRGELDAAAEVARRLDVSRHAGSAMPAPWHAALGRLALVERRDADALGHFSAWRDCVAGVRNPACFAAWRSASARALTSLGRHEEAIELAAEELALVRSFGAPRAVSVALRELAHASARGDFDEPIALLEEAVAVARVSEARLERCRALLELGTLLRRAGRRSDAGRALGEALELARACGARLLQERAEAELEVAGTRVQRAARRGADALSPSERRVVALAIDGLSNRQIAEALFVTRKAVEWHLGNAYRKLEVRSRGELAGVVGPSIGDG
ncbi:MAG TPA: AAA family ATPase [Solirubrobacteraceae bacterium]|nr:AAA family ATPase [Solirubrobacteraceae bacterium]